MGARQTWLKSREISNYPFGTYKQNTEGKHFSVTFSRWLYVLTTHYAPITYPIFWTKRQFSYVSFSLDILSIISIYKCIIRKWKFESENFLFSHYRCGLVEPIVLSVQGGRSYIATYITLFVFFYFKFFMSGFSLNVFWVLSYCILI